MSSEVDKYIGSIVSVYCEDGSCLQGQLITIDQKNGTFELKHPFRNGRQMKQQTLNVGYTEVVNIKILKIQDPCSEVDKNQVKESESSVSEEKNCTKMQQKHFSSEMEPEFGNCHQTTCSSSLPQSNSTSPSKFSNSLKINGIGRSDRWATKNGCDVKYQKYIPGLPKCNGKRATHGCGDPVLDSDNGFWVSKRNRHLSKPLDLETLTTDFDFEGNLALFDKVSVSMDESNHHFRKAEEKNYKHYENVISDPSRVTSWTTAPARYKLEEDATHTLYTASRIATTQKGVKIPFLSYEDKQNYLSVAESFLGSDVFHVQTADRLLMFLWVIIDRFEVMVDELVVLTSPMANPLLLNRFVQHFSNRACKTVIFGDSVVVDLPYVRHVSNPRDLPIGDGRLVIALDGQNENPDLMAWASRLPMRTHLICLEQPRNLCAIEHVLMIGVGTDFRSGGAHKEEDGDDDGLMCVTDMGIPFAWLDVRSAACLATAFATEMIVIL